MFAGIIGRLILTVTIGLCLQAIVPGPAQSASDDIHKVKELNFVFLHGMGSNSCSLQLLSDKIVEQLPMYSSIYESSSSNIEIEINTLSRCYSGYVNIETWARNIAESINTHFKGKRDLILVGHSMGGKAALYAVAHNIAGLANKTVMVVTINSPIKSLGGYYVPGGGNVGDYCRTVLLGSDEGVCESVSLWDSSDDGEWVSQNRHWLAFISSENAPLSEQYDRSGVDVWPRDMDDGVVPISAQYSDTADVLYYGEHGHSEVGNLDEVAEFVADRILRYTFGESLDYSVLARSGSMEHNADWLLGTDKWDDVVGEIVIDSGQLEHTNEYWTRWQEWEDVLGEYTSQTERSSIRATQLSFPVLTSIREARWFSSSDEVEDSRLFIQTSAAPRSTVRVDWTIYGKGLLPVNTSRSHYEVQITEGTPLASIRRASWVTDDTRDIRLRVWSEAQSPFRWFKATWRLYHEESRQRQVINEIPAWPRSLVLIDD